MRTNCIFELSMTLDTDDFNKLFEPLDIDDNDRYIDDTEADRGFVVIYRNSRYKKKVTIQINTALLLKDSTSSVKLVHKLGKRIEEYFDSEYSIDDFTVAGFTIVGFIGTGSKSLATDYIKVLSRIGKVKGFSPADFEDIDKGLLLSGNSNGIDFLLYDLTEKLHDKGKGVICSEVRLTKCRTIRYYADVIDTAEQIKTLYDNSLSIFMDTFRYIIPVGDFYKKGAADEIIRKKVDDLKLMRRMLRLVALIPDKKSLLLAQKALNYRKVDTVMEGFAAIGLSPVTISKRQETRHLKNIYSLL